MIPMGNAGGLTCRKAPPKKRQRKNLEKFRTHYDQRVKKWHLACPPNDQNLVFPNLAGKPMCQSHMLSRHFRPALKAAGLEGIRFHDLRHTFASLLIQQKANPKYIQEWLGHGSIITTMDLGRILFQVDHQHFIACILRHLRC